MTKQIPGWAQVPNRTGHHWRGMLADVHLVRGTALVITGDNYDEIAIPLAVVDDLRGPDPRDAEIAELRAEVERLRCERPHGAPTAAQLAELTRLGWSPGESNPVTWAVARLAQFTADCAAKEAK